MQGSGWHTCIELRALTRFADFFEHCVNQAENLQQKSVLIMTCSHFVSKCVTFLQGNIRIICANHTSENAEFLFPLHKCLGGI